MGSAISTPAAASTTPLRLPRAGDWWPARARTVWALRGALAAPYVLLTVWTYVGGYRSTSDEALVRHAQLIPWGSSHLAFVPRAYPPLPILAAEIVPHALAVALLGALAAGVILEVIGSHLARLGFPLLLIGVLLVSFGASPSFAYTTTTDLPDLMALALLAVSLGRFLAFVQYRQTHNGFAAGMAIGLAGLCQPFALVCAPGFALVAPLVAIKQFRGQRAVARATAAVLLFPTVAGVAAWTFINWRFTGSALSWLHDAAPHIWDDHLTASALTSALNGVKRPLIYTPLYPLTLILVLIRRQWYIAATILMPLLDVILALWLGFPLPGPAIAILLGVVALIALPRRPSLMATVAIIVVAVANLVAKWLAVSSPAIAAWQHALR